MNSQKPTSIMPSSSALEDVSIDVRALIRAVVFRKFMILFCAVIGLVLGIYLAYIAATPRYTATSVVMLNDRQEQVLDYQSVISGLSADNETVNNELQVLRSRNLLEKVVERQGLEQDSEFNPTLRTPSGKTQFMAQIKEKVLSFLLRSIAQETEAQDTSPAFSQDELARQLTTDAVLNVLTVRNVPQSLVFEISVETTSPRKSQDLANAIAQVYVDSQLAIKYNASEQATVWLTKRVEELRTSLLTAENELKQFQTEIDVISSETLALQEVRLKETRDRISDMETSLIAAVARQADMAAAETPAQQVAASDDAQLMRLLPRIDTPAVRTSFDTRFASLKTRVDADIQRQQSQIAGLKSSRDELAAVIARQGRDLLDLQQREREVDATRSVYEYFLNRLMETSALEGTQQADSRMLSEAKFPFMPSSPQKTRILVLLTALGAIVGIAIAIVRELGATNYRTSNEIEAATPYSVIGQIPRIPRHRRLQILDYFSEKPASAPAEAVRNLRTSILLSNVKAPPKVVMITSSLPGEGKTTISYALAMNLGMMGKKVLLVEGDIRRGAFKEYFPEESKNGKFVKVLEERLAIEEAVMPNEKLHCDVLFAGETRQNVADLFTTDAFKGSSRKPGRNTITSSSTRRQR